MTARTSPTSDTTSGQDARAVRMMPTSSAVMNVVVRVAGIVPVRLDLTHVGTIEQQLGLSLGTVLIYLRSGLTARAVAEEWKRAAVAARSLSPAIAGRRPVPVGPSTIATMVQLAGMPQVTTAFESARAGSAVPALLRVHVGPITWEVCDTNAYTSLLRAWRQAARLLGDNPADEDD